MSKEIYNDLKIGQKGYACFGGIIAKTIIKEIIYREDASLSIVTGEAHYHYVYNVEVPSRIDYLSPVERHNFFSNQQELIDYLNCFESWFK